MEKNIKITNTVSYEENIKMTDEKNNDGQKYKEKSLYEDLKNTKEDMPESEKVISIDDINMADINESKTAAYEENDIQLPVIRQQLNLERHYGQLMYIHEAAIEQLTAKLNILKGEFQFSNDRNPISSISSRIKSKESIICKLKKKGLPMTMSALVENIHDIAGVRVVCTFIEDVYAVARMLVRQKDIEVLQVKDYIRNPKENGYRSLHMILSIEIDFAEITKKVTVEVQIRTIAMDFWASTEHQLRYKKDCVFSQEVHDKLKECAELMAKADSQMQEIAGNFSAEQW